jgi:hypothetical protein
MHLLDEEFNIWPNYTKFKNYLSFIQLQSVHLMSLRNLQLWFEIED